MPIPFRLEYVIEKTLASAGRREQRAIKELTGNRLSASEARALWPRILEHKWYISERLGRDTGLRVAAIDYLENVHRVRVGYRANDSLPGSLRMMQPLNRAA